MAKKCGLTPNIYMVLHSLVAAHKSKERCHESVIKPLISQVCGYSNCYCDECQAIAKEFYTINHCEINK